MFYYGASLVQAAASIVAVDATATAGFDTASPWSFNLATLSASVNKVIGVWGYRNTSAPTVTFGGETATGSASLTPVVVPTDARLLFAWWDAADLPSPGSNVALVADYGGLTRGAAACIALTGAAQGTPSAVTNTGATNVLVIATSSALTVTAGGIVIALAYSGDGDEAWIACTGGSGTWVEVTNYDEPANDDRIGICYLTNQSGSVTPQANRTTNVANLSIHAITVAPA